jgi:uncharacterized protein YkwD
MSRLVRFVCAAFVLLFAGTAPLTLGAQYALAASSYSAEAQQALALLNTYRKSKRLTQVVLDPTLTKMAQDLAKACVAAGRCDHNTGGSFADRLRKAGVAAGYGAENLRKNEATIEAAFAWWKGSSIHNSNMLIPQVRRLGFARLPATGKGFWVLIVTD